MSNTKPSEPMKIMIRRLGGGDAIVHVANIPKASRDHREYRYVSSRYQANTNMVDASIAKGYIEQDKMGQYVLSALGRSIYEKRNGKFVHWQVSIASNYAEIVQEYGDDVDLAKHLWWSCKAVPMGNDGPVSWYSLNVQEWEFRKCRTLDALLSHVSALLMRRAGFSKHEIIIPELTPEMVQLDEKQQMFFTLDTDKKAAEYAEIKERAKREEQMDENHFLMTPISTLSLSVKASNCLRVANISVLGELINMRDTDILAIKNAGRQTLNDIKEALAARSLHLGMVKLQEWQVEEIERLKGERLSSEGHARNAVNFC